MSVDLREKLTHCDFVGPEIRPKWKTVAPGQEARQINTFHYKRPFPAIFQLIVKGR